MNLDEPLALHFECHGAGQPLVILHGLFGSGRNWRSVANALAGEHEVYCVDLRNHGHSPHAPVMDYDALAADCAALLERLNLREVSLVGHSMGGKTAMTLALAHAQRLSRLIIVDIAPVAYADSHTALIEAMLALPLDRIKRRADADALLAPAIPAPSIRLFLLQNLEFEAGTARWRINLPVLKREMAKLVGAIPAAAHAVCAMPSIFIRGGRSDRVLDRHIPVISRYFPRHEIVTIPQAGHWPHAETPAAFMEALTAALQTEPPPR